MIIVVCVSKNMGLLFNNRRVSRDRAICADVLSMCKQKQLYALPQAEVLFCESDAKNVVYTSDYLNEAGEGDYVFYEGGKLNEEKVSEIVIYNFNRDYPDDIKFRIPNGFINNMEKAEEFRGNSHEKITKIYYTRG